MKHKENQAFLASLAKIANLYGYQIISRNDWHQLWSGNEEKIRFKTVREIQAFLLGHKHASKIEGDGGIGHASLIAAAPDMLEALQEMLNYPSSGCARKRAEAAIDKATSK